MERKNMKDLEKEDLLKLYEVIVQEERYFLSEHQNRINFFQRISAALFAGSVLGIYYFSLRLAPVLMLAQIATVIIAWIGYKGVSKLYQRFLEAITTRAKIEHDLGMTTKRNEDINENKWFIHEPYINSRYMKTRNDSSTTSGDWVQAHKRIKGSYDDTAWILFLTIIILSSLLFLYVIILTLCTCFIKYCK